MTEKKEIIIEDIDRERFVTRAEFLALIIPEGMKGDPSIVRMAIFRNLLIEKEGFIDMEDPTNKNYYISISKRYKNDVSKEKSLIDAKKREVELKIKEEDLKMKEIQVQKLEGLLIPTDLVIGIFKTHFRTVYQQMSYACEQIANDTIRKMGGTKTDIAEMKGVLVTILNEHIEKAKQGSANDLNEIKSEYESIKFAKDER